ncbi:hypothetical protein like AT1G23710 [Hibiscus trionum]|uniref:Uncharacterized protein n=1 Tax=Hibiscus trionum TaxID=183268 RepID=A0A9W7I2T3_HIBTR|nr:hypothetical protein like AT1G23710 [Hibiscus trionum]
MQVMNSSPSLSPSFSKYSPDIDADKFTHDFGFKLQDGSEEEDQEFSFVCVNADGSPVSADDMFQNGQIRPVFPLFNQDLIFAGEDGSVSKSRDGDVSPRPSPRKLFVGDSSVTLEPVGPYCEWKRDDRITVEATSLDTCKKSNSTGFSKLRRVRDLMLRSNSDGKDAFVLLNHPFPFSVSAAKTEKKNEKEEKKAKVKGVGEKPPNGKKEKSEKTSAASAHEKLYVRNRAMREGDKRRNVHPF